MSAAAAMLAGAAMAMPGAPAAGTTVDMPGRLFTPRAVQVLTGETVTWRNSDHAVHSVAGGSLASGRMAPGATYSFTFEKPGTYAYHCTVHRTMRGSVTVAALGLTGPTAPVLAGGHAMLEALVPAGTETVTLERDTGEPVAEATPGPDGRATFHVSAAEPGTYRARAGELSSLPYRLQVAPVVRMTARRVGRRIRVRASITPAQPGATVALERYVRERFDYRPVARTRTAAGTRAAFTLRTRRRSALKVAVVRPLRGWSVGRSAHVTVRSLR